MELLGGHQLKKTPWYFWKFTSNIALEKTNDRTQRDQCKYQEFQDLQVNHNLYWHKLITFFTCSSSKQFPSTAGLNNNWMSTFSAISTWRQRRHDKGIGQCHTDRWLVTFNVQCTVWSFWLFIYSHLLILCGGRKTCAWSAPQIPKSNSVWGKHASALRSQR